MAFKKAVTELTKDLSNLFEVLSSLFKKPGPNQVKAKTHRKKETKPKTKPMHPWRICPAGQHYRRAHGVSAYTTAAGKEVGAYHRDWTCADNPSGKDQLYPEEMDKIAEDHFDQFKSTPLPPIPGFHGKDAPYDHLIQGWTQYWNDVLKPVEPLDPRVVKALVASESGFRPDAWNGKRGSKRARGLAQVTDKTLRYLALPKHKELKDHFLQLSEDDMLNPNFSICAGTRWLFRKKELTEAKAKRPVTWLETIKPYKSEKSREGLIDTFTDYYNKMKYNN